MASKNYVHPYWGNTLVGGDVSFREDRQPSGVELMISREEFGGSDRWLKRSRGGRISREPQRAGAKMVGSDSVVASVADVSQVIIYDRRIVVSVRILMSVLF